MDGLDRPCKSCQMAQVVTRLKYLLAHISLSHIYLCLFKKYSTWLRFTAYRIVKGLCHFFYRTRVRSLAMLVTHSLPNSLPNSVTLSKFIDVTLVCEDANSKLIEVVAVADVDDEDHVGNSLLQIWKLRFGQKAKLLFKL